MKHFLVSWVFSVFLPVSWQPMAFRFASLAYLATFAKYVPLPPCIPLPPLTFSSFSTLPGVSLPHLATLKYLFLGSIGGQQLRKNPEALERPRL